jgi:hypothetical protein
MFNNENLSQFLKIGLGMVAHGCHPSYLGDGDGKDCCLRAAQVKSLRAPLFNH